MRGVLLEAAAKLPRILARSAPQLPRTESDDDVIRSPGPDTSTPHRIVQLASGYEEF